MAAAPEIVWSVIRKNSSFKRSNGFSAEPVNVLNKHSYKYSGAVQPSVSIVDAGKGAFVAVNTTTKTNKPIKAKNVTNVKKGVARGTNAVNKVCEMLASGWAGDFGAPCVTH